MMWCAELCRYVWCGLVCWVVCWVVSVVCGVLLCVFRVWRGLARGKKKKKTVCRFKTLPCVPAKRAHVEHMRAFCRHTRKRFEPTHGDVLNPHTGRREVRGSLISLSSLLSRPFSLSLLSFFFLSSVVLFLRSLSLLFLSPLLSQ